MAIVLPVCTVIALRGIAVVALIAAALFWNIRTSPEVELSRELDTQTAG